MNISENEWGILVAKDYEDGKKYDTLLDLREAIQKAMDGLDQKVNLKLFLSIPESLVRLFNRAEARSIVDPNMPNIIFSNNFVVDI